MLFWSLHVHPLLDCPLLLSLSLTPMFLDSKIFQGPWPWDSCYSAASKPPTFVGHHTYARRGSGAAEPRMTWTTGMTQLWSCWSVGLERSGTVLDCFRCFSILNSSYHISSHFINVADQISSDRIPNACWHTLACHASCVARNMISEPGKNGKLFLGQNTTISRGSSSFRIVSLPFFAILCPLLIFWFSLVLNI